ncbi:hypothetical protein BVG79_01502 [Ketogulonicigenium robustum]|uniref:Uncharacterized protein n=1 Tax=Ketogulonicigenium robustum TaxID=92947 RepID=A0A1W6P020_9RHOB|nr:hypothetical protein [Ketogulonicigenium robustum]ARO14848.1 hypothetical protein BVG79_01502 [Ketogulonicigenium robustum]
MSAMRKINTREDLSTVLRRTAVEAEGLAISLGTLDAELGVMLSRLGPDSTGNLHMADGVRQAAAGLALFLRGIAATIGPDGRCDAIGAAQQLGLRAQAARLGGTTIATPVSGLQDLWLD